MTQQEEDFKEIIGNFRLPVDKKQSWVNALRSGLYKQGKFKLCDISNHYCCLGVFAQIDNSYIKDNSDILSDYIEYTKNNRTYDANISEDDIPFDIQEFLIDLNDNGITTFNKIADLIEEYL